MMRLRILIGLVLLSFAPISAQQSVATLTGRVLDQNGNVVGNTKGSILLKNTATGADFSAPVSDAGDFRLTGLPPGAYDVSVPARPPMYGAYSEKNVTLKAGENKIDFRVPWHVNLGTFGDDQIQLANDILARQKVDNRPTARMPDGKPDLNGMWVRMTDPPGGPPNPIPLQPWAAEIAKQLQKVPGDNRPTVFCLPFSALMITAGGFPHKLVHTPTLLIDIAEFETPGYRQIFLDGRPHPDPERWNPSWLGHSIGKWEGDTLVVDTVGFNEMAGGVGVHTEKLHIVERFRRPDFAHLIVDITVNDPEAYTKPWHTSARFQLAPDEEILEFICAENNQTPTHVGGGGGYKHRP